MRLFDTTAIHAEAAVELALDGQARSSNAAANGGSA
jgi:hypothetical protein